MTYETMSEDEAAKASLYDAIAWLLAVKSEEHDRQMAMLDTFPIDDMPRLFAAVSSIAVALADTLALRCGLPADEVYDSLARRVREVLG